MASVLGDQEVPERSGLSRLVIDDDAMCQSDVMRERGYVRDGGGRWVVALEPGK